MAGPTKKPSGELRAVTQAHFQKALDELRQCASVGPTGTRCALPLHHAKMSPDLARHRDDAGRAWTDAEAR